MSATVLESAAGKMSSASFKRFSSFIEAELGIKMPVGKLTMLQGRLQRRLRALELNSIDEYMEKLFEAGSDSGELVHFVDAVTTNKTDFLREPRHFDYLRSHALPSLDARPGQPWQAKAWCAGCSSGDEPYTLAMVLSEHAAARPGFDFSILGTDISTRVLDTARQAIYPKEKIDPVPEAWRKRYLLRSRDASAGLVRIVPALRQRVSFERLNFMDQDYSIRTVFDFIFFRNVMIYFDKPTQEAVVTRLCRNLRPGGYLFVGHSESLTGLKVPVELESSAVYRKPMNGGK